MFEDHQKVGKKLVPKFGQDWSRVDFVEVIFPEIIWIGFVLAHCGATKGIELATTVIEAAFHGAAKRPQPEFSFISAHRELTDEGKAAVRGKLRTTGQLDELRAALEPFVRCYAKDNPFTYLWEEALPPHSEVDVATARKVVGPRLNRWSPEGTLMQAVVLYGEHCTGRLHSTENVRPPNLEAIVSDFDSPEGRRASSHARTSTSMVYGHYKDRLGSAWAEYFWRRGLELDPLRPHIRLPTALPTSANPVMSFRQGFHHVAASLVKEVSEQVVFKATSEEEHTVINALLARQATLAVALADNFEVWNWDIGPLYLRAMTDCYITLAWILGKPDERSRLHIMHGLGQEKLWMAHYEKLAEKAEDEEEKEGYRQMIEASRAWVESQSFLFFVTVNLGNWTGKNTREMAVEAGCLDLYNYAYTPYSFSAHNTWNHLGKFNAIPSASPLHKNMRMPNIPHFAGEPSIMMNAAKYLDKSIAAVAKHYGLREVTESAYAWSGSLMREVYDFLSNKYGGGTPGQ